MPNATDARYLKCEQRIQEALLCLLATKSLAEVGVSELSREANVSRATFYAHYENVIDVFDQLVQQALANVQTIDERFSCEQRPCRGSERKTYCERLRSNGKWSSVTRDPRFFSSMMSIATEDGSLAFDHGELGISKVQAEALRLFQMSGCHSIATSNIARRKDWAAIREIIDVFIEGGLNAIRSR